MTILLQRFIADRRGATAIEYGLIGAILTAAIIFGFGAFSTQLSNVLLAAGDAMVQP